VSGTRWRLPRVARPSEAVSSVLRGGGVRRQHWGGTTVDRHARHVGMVKPRSMRLGSPNSGETFDLLSSRRLTCMMMQDKMGVGWLKKSRRGSQVIEIVVKGAPR